MRRYAGLNYRSIIFCVRIVRFILPNCVLLMIIPALFFIDGDPACLHTCQLAVVGSRSHSWYGERWGRLLCESLAKSGLTITSGLARGIDGVAHNAAVSMGEKV